MSLPYLSSHTQAQDTHTLTEFGAGKVAQWLKNVHNFYRGSEFGSQYPFKAALIL